MLIRVVVRSGCQRDLYLRSMAPLGGVSLKSAPALSGRLSFGSRGNLPAVVPALAASLSTALTGADNDVTLVAKTAGVAGNLISLKLTDPAGASQALACTVTGTDINVSLATSAGSAITSTAADIIGIIVSTAGATALVSAQTKVDNKGTGVVTALAKTNLAGGADSHS